jgi:hypothetical protein
VLVGPREKLSDGFPSMSADRVLEVSHSEANNKKPVVIYGCSCPELQSITFVPIGIGSIPSNASIILLITKK